MRKAEITLFLLIITLTQVCAEWGNLLAEKQEGFEIRGSFNMGNRTVNLKLYVELLFRVWGQKTMDPGRNYTIAVEVVRKSSFIEVEGMKIEIGGMNPAFSYKFSPVTIAYVARPEIELFSCLRINASGRIFLMDHDDGEVILIPVEGSRKSLEIIPEYMLNGSFSGAVLTKEFRLVNVGIGEERGEGIEVKFSESMPAGYQQNLSEGMEKGQVSAAGVPNIAAGAILIIMIVALVILLLYIRPKSL